MAILTREEYNKLRKQSEKSTSQSGIMTKAEYDKLDKSQLFSGSVLEQYNESITKGTKNTNNKNNNGLLSAFNDGYDFGDITKTLWKGAKQLSGAIDTTRRELMLNPVQTAKTAVVSTAHGVNKASNSINNALSDFSNWIMGRDKKYHLSLDELNKLQKTGTNEEKRAVLNKYLQEYGANSSEFQLAHQILNIPDTRSDFVKAIDNVVNKKYYETDTYKNHLKGNMTPGQKNIWNIGENIGNMLPSMAVSTVTGVPVLGSAVFFTQAQQNYTEEAKTRGYEDKDARTYGLIMGGLESLVERLGFDQLGGLKKMSQGNLLKSMVGEGLEEFVMPYIDSTIKSVGYNEKFDLQETTEEAIKSAVSGAIVGGIMNLGGQGFQQVDNLVNKINNNENVTSDDILGAVEEIQKTNPEYFDEIIEELPKVLDDKTITEIQEKINQKEVVDKKILPTVEEIVAQEKNTNEIKMPIVNKTVDNSSNLEQKTLDREFLTNYDQRTAQLLNMNERNIIVKNYKQLDLLIDEALTTQSNNALHFGKINENIITRIKKKIQNLPKGKENYLSKNDYDLVINQSEIRHLRDNKTRLTNEEIHNYVRKLPEIITESDTISYTVNNKSEGLRFKKVMDDGTYISFVLVSNKKGTLTAKSIFLDKQDFETKKRSISPTNDVLMTSNKTSETDGALASYVNNDTIKPSKSQIAPLPNTSNMQNNQDNSINMPIVENSKTQNDVNNNQPAKIAEILEERPVTMEEKDSWLKKLTTIKILDKGYYVDKLARQENNRELSSKYDYMLMANGIAQQIIGNERFNPKTQKTYGDGLHKIFEPIENSGKLKDFSEYMYHKHNISRMSLDTLFQEENKPIFDDSITSEISKSIVEKYESENPEFVEWAEEIYDYNNFLLDILVDYEVISSEDKQYYNKKYPYYVPTIRVNDKTKVQMDFIGKKASVNNPIKTAKGGNQDIIPLKEAMALRTMQTLNSALRNNFGNELLNTIQVDSNSNKVNIDEVIGDDIDTEDFLTKSDKKSPATLTVFKNGEKTTFDITDEIYEALAPSKRYRIKVFNTISKLRRALITEYNPTFMLTNPIKDIQDGTLNSKHPTLFAKNLAEATKQIATKGEFYKSYIANGGSYETYFNYGEGYNKMPVKRNWYDPRKVLDKISQLNQKIEMTPRLAEYISSIEAGDSIETAMYNAQEITTNFKRGGDWTKNLDANGVTFLNASVQGTVKQIRNFQEAKSQGIKGMMNLAVKWSIAGLTPYILSQLIWNDDEDYEELSDYVKNNYYILWKNNDGTFIRIPKGRVLSVIQNLFKQGLDTLKGEKIDIPEFVQLLQNQVLPSDPTESNIISPILDVMQNKAWHGGTLVPQRLQNLPEEEQYDESTDSISIWLGKKLGISPIKINYILDQYSGAIGDIILPTLTLEAENDSNSFLSNIVAPLKSKFTTDSVMNNQNIRDLYDLDDELTKKAKSSNATAEDTLKSKYINAIQTEMNKLTAEKRNIQNDTTLTNNEKYKQVKEIQKKINALAKEGLNNYQKIELYDNYAKVGDKEYYLNSSNEWQKLDTTTAKYKTVKQITTYDKYITYQKNIDNVKDNYDNTNQRKSAVINYVNSLKLSIPQKAMLIKLNYSSYDTYNKQIIEYIVNQKLTATEKSEILTKLGFTVKDGRVYY